MDRGAKTEWAAAFGHADRRHEILNTSLTQLAIASGTKGLTALTLVSLIQDGLLSLQTTARSVLGADLPLVSDAVTVGQLLTHRSGIGDYVDEDEERPISDYILPVCPSARLDGGAYVGILEGRPTKFPPGQRFSYCNSGYVILALIAERVTGMPFADLLRKRVCDPAGMADTGSLRSDALPGSAAVGYVSVDGVWRTNVLHLPVMGSGDGGLYSTVADIHALWAAFFGGQVVSPEWVSAMVEPRSDVPAESMRYGMGFWLHASASRNAGRLRRRGVVPECARSRLRGDSHDDLQHLGWSLADHQTPRQPGRAPVSRTSTCARLSR